MQIETKTNANLAFSSTRYICKIGIFTYMATINITTFIFDLDGTLLDTLEDLTSSVNYALQTNGYQTHSMDEVRMMVGNGVGKLIQRALPQDTSEGKKTEVLSSFRNHYLKHSEDTTKPYDGIIEILQKLKERGKKVAVVSNKFDKATKRLCMKYFEGLVDIALGEDEANGIHKKPAPDMVFKAMKELGSAPNECVYIGDSDVDIDTASNAGIICISVLWGFRSMEFLCNHGAKLFAKTPSEIIDIAD